MRKALTCLMIAAAAAGFGGAKAAAIDDPYLWLEEMSSPKALQWVEAHNAKSTAKLEADPRYSLFFGAALDIAQAKDRIPVGSFRGKRFTISGRTRIMSAASGGRPRSTAIRAASRRGKP